MRIVKAKVKLFGFGFHREAVFFPVNLVFVRIASDRNVHQHIAVGDGQRGRSQKADLRLFIKFVGNVQGNAFAFKFGHTDQAVFGAV